MTRALTTERLTLIPLLSTSEAQRDELVEAWDNPEVFRYVGVGLTGFTREDLDRGLANVLWYSWSAS